jgi:hypothetical protein
MAADQTAKILTAALLVAIAGIALAPGLRMSHLLRRLAAPPSEPQDAIYSMLNAARAGDVKAYLGAYTGPMEAGLRETVAENSEPAFAQYLKGSAAGIKGVALSDPEKASEAEAKVRVEYIYQDRNEVQTMYLEKHANAWKIARTDAGERIPTLIPYGTPVK